MGKYIDAYRLKARLVQDVIPINPTWGDAKQAWQEGYNNALMSVADRLEEMPAADVTPQWIPVTERLPKTHKDVLVSKHGKTRLGYRSVSYWMVISGEGSFTTTDVDAWMPLPEPYKEVQE